MQLLTEFNIPDGYCVHCGAAFRDGDNLHHCACNCRVVTLLKKSAEVRAEACRQCSYNRAGTCLVRKEHANA